MPLDIRKAFILNAIFQIIFIVISISHVKIQKDAAFPTIMFLNHCRIGYCSIS